MRYNCDKLLSVRVTEIFPVNDRLMNETQGIQKAKTRRGGFFVNRRGLEANFDATAQLHAFHVLAAGRGGRLGSDGSQVTKDLGVW